MIGNYLEEIRSELQGGLNAAGGPDRIVKIGNIAFWENDRVNGEQLKGKIVMSVVKIEEERTLRYQERSTEINNVLHAHNPTVFVNAYVLLSVLSDLTNTNPREDLNDLTNIIRYFQGKSIFAPNDGRPDQLTFELCTLTFEQMNHLWGIMGGKYIPSVLYKVRMIPVKALPNDGQGRITKITENETAL